MLIWVIWVTTQASFEQQFCIWIYFPFLKKIIKVLKDTWSNLTSLQQYLDSRYNL